MVAVAHFLPRAPSDRWGIGLAFAAAALSVWPVSHPTAKRVLALGLWVAAAAVLLSGRLHGRGYGFVVAGVTALGVVAAFMVIRHHRRVFEPQVGYATPDRFAGATQGSMATPMPDGRLRINAHSPFPVRSHEGNLPFSVHMEGPYGEREGVTDDVDLGTSFLWTAESVTIVNRSDEPITCMAFLVVASEEGGAPQTLTRQPNEPICLSARGTAQVTLQFRHKVHMFSDRDRLVPETPEKLVLAEVGPKQRNLTALFTGTGSGATIRIADLPSPVVFRAPPMRGYSHDDGAPTASSSRSGSISSVGPSPN